MARRNAKSVSEAIVVQSGSPRYLGTIDFTSAAKTNATATTAFNVTGLQGKVLLLQPSQDVYILPLPVATPVAGNTVSSTNGITVYANERVEISMDDPDSKCPAGELYAWLGAIRVSADGNLKVWELV